ncbi:DUF475 domain-containing protein [Planotetraspora phitsanulokensis]|uniref:DUF475 domain-containing protein n=1 Tax=Planotetraspora phitsanulokensis TaxID=575192 RepID=A0A8J3U519_9ACTN|nr:DUF475 domain-containing protein [Planotetraspora phitsanulokensis]GII36164.1 hypothetical protein Pph01_11670 [Planotetraspora phitsanulokensis]
MIIRTFGWSFGVSAIGLVAALAMGGPGALALVAILAVLEISLSFDNAVVNARVIERMSRFWQRMFLTVGIVIAVFGMRLAFPLLIVGVTARLSPGEAIGLALDDAAEYGRRLHEAHPLIAAFGGMFLLLIFLDFVFEEREFAWLAWLERPLAKIGKLDQLSVVVALAVLLTATSVTASEPGPVLAAGVLGIVTYLLVNSLGRLFEAGGEEGDDDSGATTAGAGSSVGKAVGGEVGGKVGGAVGRAGFFLFLYLEVLDASFSFDGVVGAFAISDDLLVIALGLGIGAMYIRSLTIFLVRRGTLNEYVYLEHGAHWAIGALAAIMLIGLGHDVPEIVTGLIGLAFIGTAMISSTVRNRRVAGASGLPDGAHAVLAGTPSTSADAVGTLGTGTPGRH